MSRWLLRQICFEPPGRESPAHGPGAPEDPLAKLRREFAPFFGRFFGARVVDFGSGWGFQSLALLRLGAARVLALETVEERRAFTKQEAERQGLGGSLCVLPAATAAERGSYDFVISQDAMEHFDDPGAALAEMCSLLRPGGRLLLSFGPPWYAPYGAHLRFMSPVPWIQLLFSENALMRARGRFRRDGARLFSEVEGGLNQLSVVRFEALLASSGFQVERCAYRCVWGLGFLGWLPWLRELFINHISVVAARKS